MNAPLTLGKFPLRCRSIALAVMAILMLIAPHEVSAKGGIKSNTFNPFSRAEAATITSSPLQTHPTTPTFSGCGGKRYRDPYTHQCRGPADFGH
jgi:hypothetical protein